MYDGSIWTLSFAVYSLIGWACESAYCSAEARRWINRGFLAGPFCPIYAVGAGFLLLTFRRVLALPQVTRDTLPGHMALVFAVGTVVTTAVEYGSALLLEGLFHARWWDYSHCRFNFKGRICLTNSLLFGLLSTALVYFLEPAVSLMLAALPRPLLPWLAGAFAVYFCADAGFTVASVLNLNQRLEALAKAASALRERLDSTELAWTPGTRELLAEHIEKLRGMLPTDPRAALRDTIARLADATRRSQRRLLKAFPELRSTRYPEIVVFLRAWLPGRKGNGRCGGNKR